MRVGLSWLAELVEVDLPPDKLAHLLSFSGTKVEAVHRPGRDVAGVVVAEVLSVRPHPRADNLVLVDVATGGGAAQPVVCGARNFSPGDRVPYAAVGARVAAMEISERKFRGEASRGMLCSAAELGVSKDHSGILVLPPDAPLGEDVSDVLGLDDVVLELEVTTNRPDCLGMVGVAREVAALTGSELRMPDGSWPHATAAGGPLSVDIQDPHGCPRYVGVWLGEVTVGPAPGWMTRRLLAAGLRSISSVVDVTNYVMLETGHPTHAFDAARISGSSITVRRARRGERLRTLDGMERDLHPEDLVIADPDGPVAFGGIMGGEASEVSDATAAVVLESAHFDPATVAFTARRHGLRTEASARFERGADPEAAGYAAARAVRLLLEIEAARSAGPVRDEYPSPEPRRKITLRPSRTDALLGVATSSREQADLLRAVGFEVRPSPDGIEAVVPSFRPDVRREVDLIEEVARLAGLERLPSTLPPGAPGGLEREQQAVRGLRRAVAAAGVFEAATTSFASPTDLDALGLAPDHPARVMVELANPLTEDERYLRTSLLPGLLRSAARNFAHQAPGAALFEIGRVYRPGADRLPSEPEMVSAVLAGVKVPKGWRAPEQMWDFFAAKGVLEGALAALGLPAGSYTALPTMPFHPTRAAAVSIAEAAAGVLGELHPEVCERFGLPERACAFEIALDPVLAALPGRSRVQELPRFPPVFLDVAVVVDEHVPEASVSGVMAAAGAPELVAVRLFDLYRGDQVPAGKKSLAYAIELRAPQGTLTAYEANAVRDRIVTALRERTGAELRA